MDEASTCPRMVKDAVARRERRSDGQGRRKVPGARKRLGSSLGRLAGDKRSFYMTPWFMAVDFI